MNQWFLVVKLKSSHHFEGFTFAAMTVFRRVWRKHRGNHNPYIKGEQTTQSPKEKGNTLIYLIVCRPVGWKRRYTGSFLVYICITVGEQITNKFIVRILLISFTPPHVLPSLTSFTPPHVFIFINQFYPATCFYLH